jgi:hypothetical protein
MHAIDLLGPSQEIFFRVPIHSLSALGIQTTIRVDHGDKEMTAPRKVEPRSSGSTSFFRPAES